MRSVTIASAETALVVWARESNEKETAFSAEWISLGGKAVVWLPLSPRKEGRCGGDAREDGNGRMGLDVAVNVARLAFSQTVALLPSPAP